MTCSYIVRLAQVDSWLGQRRVVTTRHDDDEAFRRGERMGRVGFDSRIFFPWMALRSPVSHFTRKVPFPRRAVRRTMRRTSSTLKHHSSGGPGDCDLQLQARRWILGWGNLVHDTTTTMPGPCSGKSASPREGRGHVSPFPGMAGHPCLTRRCRDRTINLAVYTFLSSLCTLLFSLSLA